MELLVLEILEDPLASIELRLACMERLLFLAAAASW